MPLFITASRDNKLDETDAKFVDVIHTNALLQGKIERCGHVDFYMNGGIVQPGCFQADSSKIRLDKQHRLSNLFADPFACSHHRSPDYYAESIRSYKGFWGWACSSYVNYLLGLCPRTNFLVVAGEDCVPTTRGMFLITTNGVAPFATGRWTDSAISITKNNIADIITPIKKSDPLIQQLDQWGKLEGDFNNIKKNIPFNGLLDTQWDDVMNDLPFSYTPTLPNVVKKVEKKMERKRLRTRTAKIIRKNSDDHQLSSQNVPIKDNKMIIK